jgi:hypothetical protein
MHRRIGARGLTGGSDRDGRHVACRCHRVATISVALQKAPFVPELKSETDTSYFDDFEEAVAIRTKGKPKVQRSLRARAHVIHVIHARSHARTHAHS